MYICMYVFDILINLRKCTSFFVTCPRDWPRPDFFFSTQYTMPEYISVLNSIPLGYEVAGFQLGPRNLGHTNRLFEAVRLKAIYLPSRHKS